MSTALHSRRAAQATLKPKPPHHHDRFTHNFFGHLRFSLLAVSEDNRCLADFETIQPELVRQLDLKAITVRSHGIEIEAFQGAPAEKFKAPGRIAQGQAENGAHI